MLGFDNLATKSEFPTFFKITDKTPIFKKGEKNEENLRPLSTLPNMPKYLRNTYFTKYQVSWNHTYQNNNVASERDIAHNSDS